MKRILLKISGEALSQDGLAIHPERAQKLAQMIQNLYRKGEREFAIVIGGGNIYRGSNLIAAGVDAADSHNMSMLSTVFNAVSLKNFLEKQGLTSRVLDALGVEFLERYTSLRAKKYISDGEIVILSSGSGCPFYTTDTAGVLRALETHCDAMIKLTKVDGVYDSDPVKNPDAKKIDTLTYDEVIAKDLKILDQTAIIMARDAELPVYVTHLDDQQSIEDILDGKVSGSKIWKK